MYSIIKAKGKNNHREVTMTHIEFKFFKPMRGRTIFQTPIEEVKRQYKKLALKHHPDMGGKLEDMQQVNAEYDVLKKRCYNIHEDQNGNVYTDKNQDAPDDVTDRFKDIIENLIHMEGLEIEICGSFLWVGGNTREHKEELKDMRFRWASKKKRWFLAPQGWRKKGHKELSMDEIRNNYGSQKIAYKHTAGRMLTA